MKASEAGVHVHVLTKKALVLEEVGGTMRPSPFLATANEAFQFSRLASAAFYVCFVNLGEECM